MRRLAACTILALTLPFSTNADEITDLLDSARDAYQDGNIGLALEELDFARELLQELKTAALGDFLPPAPEVWTREISATGGGALAFLGGGASVEARYVGQGERFTISIMADNPMVAAMAAMFANAPLLGQMGQVSRIGRQRVLDQNGDLTAVVDGRIMVQAKGAPVAVMMPFLEKIDFEALADFGL